MAVSTTRFWNLLCNVIFSTSFTVPKYNIPIVTMNFISALIFKIKLTRSIYKFVRHVKDTCCAGEKIHDVNTVQTKLQNKESVSKTDHENKSLAGQMEAYVNDAEDLVDDAEDLLKGAKKLRKNNSSENTNRKKQGGEKKDKIRGATST